MRVEGLEPPRREALDPKSSMSTNFITPAWFDFQRLLLANNLENINISIKFQLIETAP